MQIVHLVLAVQLMLIAQLVSESSVGRVVGVDSAGSAAGAGSEARVGSAGSASGASSAAGIGSVAWCWW